MARDRKGLFIWEKWDRGITFSDEDFRGILDPGLSADCRSNGYQGILTEWSALASIEAWGDGILEPSGLIEGDYPHRQKQNKHNPFITAEKTIAMEGESPWPF